MTENEQNQVAQLAKVPSMTYKEGVQFIKDVVLEGNIDPIYPHLFLKKMEKIIEEVKKDEDVKGAILKAAKLHINGAKNVRIGDAVIRIGATKTSYDFSTCGDPIWDSLNQIFNDVKELKEAREATLKAAFPESTTTKFGFQAPTVVVENTYELNIIPNGEVVTLAAPIKRQGEGLVVILDK